MSRKSYKVWVENNRERRRDRLNNKNRERATEARARDPEGHLEKVRQWRARNPHRDKENNRQSRARRRARIKASEVDPFVSEYISVLKGDICSYCLNTYEEVEDHIVPLSKNGTHTWDNLTASCNKCNGSKFTRSLLHFLLESKNC